MTPVYLCQKQVFVLYDFSIIYYLLIFTLSSSLLPSKTDGDHMERQSEK